MQRTKLFSEPTVEAEAAPLLDAGFTAYPAGLKISDDFDHDAKPVQVPASVTLGHQGMILSVEDIGKCLESQFAEYPDRFEIIICAGYGHRFAGRADPKTVTKN